MSNNTKYSTQNELLLRTLTLFYQPNDFHNLEIMISIISGTSPISLRLIDWFSTNYSKKHFTTIHIDNHDDTSRRFKVYNDYKLQLKAYSKTRFDPFCRWQRITFPYKNNFIETTIGQLNFFKWAISNHIISYIHNHIADIEHDMNTRNSLSKNYNKNKDNNYNNTNNHNNQLNIDHNIHHNNLLNIHNNHNNYNKHKHSFKRHELSVSASKSIKHENCIITLNFH